jgi:hypothetical protein
MPRLLQTPQFNSNCANRPVSGLYTISNISIESDSVLFEWWSCMTIENQIIVWDLRIIFSRNTKSKPDRKLEYIWNIIMQKCWDTLEIKIYSSKQFDGRWSQKICLIINAKISRLKKYFQYLNVILRRQCLLTLSFRVLICFHQQIKFCDSRETDWQFMRFELSRFCRFLTRRQRCCPRSDNELRKPTHQRLWHVIYNYFRLYVISVANLGARMIFVRLSVIVWEPSNAWSVRYDLIFLW